MSPPTLFAFLDEGRRYLDESAQVDYVHTTWRVAAEVELERLAADGHPFTVSDHYAVIGEPPGHRNPTCGLFSAAARRGLIEPIGYQQSGRPKARGRRMRVWRGTGQSQEASSKRPPLPTGRWTADDVAVPCVGCGRPVFLRDPAGFPRHRVTCAGTQP